jgi:anti-sigma regulatory factor (Ser/Thr protein kinase)
LQWRLVERGEEHQLAVLRQWASGLLPACPARDDVVMVANELASNAIRHTDSGRGGWFAVELTWYPGLVRVAVADCGGPKEPMVIEDPGGESGRGLFLVQQLSERMGMSGNPSGRLVWADITWAAPSHSHTAPYV